MSNKDYLDEDPLIANQQFTCLSFLTDVKNKSKIVGVKSRGNFNTYENACEYAKKLQQMDPYFNVFVGNVGKWLPFDPAPDSDKIENQEYANKQLNSIMKGHKENQEKAKFFHEKRKNDMIAKNMQENLNKKNNTQEESADDKITQNDSQNDILKQLNDKIKQLESKKNNLNV